MSNGPDFLGAKAEGAVFASGDQDYASAIGWEPKSQTQELLAAAKKKFPRAFAAPPAMLDSQTMNDWLDSGVKQPPPGQLFGPFWLVEEMAVLFAATGIGKSALATQIAESIARGHTIEPFDSKYSVGPQRVLYLDFELNNIQLAMRYSIVDGETREFGRKYDFSPDLHRSEMLWNGQITEGYDGFSDMFFTAVRNEVHEYDPTVVIVDNITFLDRSSTSNVNAALSIMRSLQDLKRLYGLSILVLAHTRKRRPWMPLSYLDLQGSVNIANFADSTFAIGQSRHSPDQRYVKQIKVRSGRPEYDETNVPVYTLGKFDQAAANGTCQDGESVDNFLGFEFVECTDEDDLLETRKENLKISSNVIRKIRKLAAQGETARSIARELTVSKSTVQKYAPK
ncbi:hypothetical protein BH10ACI3_BH10ACI3_15070 [soil metagenome]